MKRVLLSFVLLPVLFITSCSNFSSIEKHRIGLPEQGDSVMHIFTNQSEQELSFLHLQAGPLTRRDMRSKVYATL